MSIAYADVLTRLKEERLIHRFSQIELSGRLKITQGHYSKVEQAIKRFTYYEVKYLADSGLDLYYIYTGRRPEGRYQRLLENCSCRELLCYLHILISLECCSCKERQQQELKSYAKLCRLKYITGAENERESIFWMIRSYDRQTQAEMAGHFGIDIKKYRELERGTALPDSELLFDLYALYDIPPAYVLKDKKGLLCELEYRLNRSEAEENGIAYRYYRLLRNVYKTNAADKNDILPTPEEHEHT